MQLSLSPNSSAASSESVDLLNSPAVASTEEPATGFGDLMADLLPDAEASADSAETVAPDCPAAADAAAAQVVVDLMAWMVRTPPPPPAPISTSDLSEGEIDLAGEGTAGADTLMGQDGEGASLTANTSASDESLIRWGARDVLAAGLSMSARNGAQSATTPAPGSAAAALAVASAGEEAADTASLMEAKLHSADAAANAAETVASGQPGEAADVLAAMVTDGAESGLAPVAPGPFRLRAETRGEKIAVGGRGLPAPANSLNSSAEKTF